MTIDVELKKYTTFDVKCLVSEKEGIPIENIRLRRHNSEQNIDDHTSTLFALDIQKEHMLKLHYHTDADCPLPFNEFSPSQWHPTFNALRAFNFIGEALWRDEKVLACQCTQKEIAKKLGGYSSDLELFQWKLRSRSPNTAMVWSPETDKNWPFLLRKIIRYLTKIQVPQGSGQVVSFPHPLVVQVASFL